MTNAFCALAIDQFAMQADSFSRSKLALLQLELCRQIEQAHFALLFRENLVEESQMIAEEEHRSGIVDWGVVSDQLVEENRGHRSDILVAEAEVGAGKAGVTGFDCIWRALLARTGGGTRPHVGIAASPRLALNHVTSKNLFR